MWIRMFPTTLVHGDDIPFISVEGHNPSLSSQRMLLTHAISQLTRSVVIGRRNG